MVSNEIEEYKSFGQNEDFKKIIWWYACLFFFSLILILEDRMRGEILLM